MKRPAKPQRSGWRTLRLTEREQMAQTLQQRHSLHWHGLCIGSLTLLGMLLAAWLQKTLGVHLLSVRYAVTLSVGYLVYLLVLRLWAARLVQPAGGGKDRRWDAADALDAGDVALDVVDLARSATRVRPNLPMPTGGGGGSSEALDGAAQGLGDLAGSALDGLGSADEGAVVVVPVVAIFAIVALLVMGAGSLALLFFGWDVLLAVAVELAFSVATARVAMGVERAGWLSAAVRLTWKPLLGALLCAVALGATIDHFLPRVDSLPEAVRLLRHK